MLFRHAGHPPDSPEHRPAHQPLVEALRSLLADGAAAGAFDVDDAEATALLVFSAIHAFDPTFREDDRLSDDRLVRSTRQLLRRAVGVAEPPPPASQPRRPAAQGRREPAQARRFRTYIGNTP